MGEDSDPANMDGQSGPTARVQFNKNRKIIIRNVPPVTYEEVKDFLSGYQIDNISISKKWRHAIVTLVDGDKAEEICWTLQNERLLGTEVTVSIYPNDNLLCVAHLPFNLEDKEFHDIVCEFGGVERCFLLKSDSGRSKGYGFVEWQHNKEKSSQAREMIDNKKLGSCTLHCEFLEPTILSFEDLHSKCIRVDHLPPNFKNESELLSILSLGQDPKFYRLGTRSEGQEFAIVSYEDASAAERAQQNVNGFMLNGHRIRVTYCIPGQRPEEIYSRLMSANAAAVKGSGLLPSPPPLLNAPPPGPSAAGVNSQQRAGPGPGPPPGFLGNVPDITNPAMQNLLAQSPQVLQTFQTILSQLQQQSVSRVPGSKPGLLGMAPHMPHNNVLLNPNMQVALLAVILASQIQQAQPSILNNPLLQQMISSSTQQQSNASRPSLLGNPMIAQANMMLQTTNLVKMLSGPAPPNAHNINIGMLANFSQLVNILQQGMGGSLPDQGPPGDQGRNSSSVAGGGQNSGSAPKGLLGDKPNAQHPPSLLGDRPGAAPPSLLGNRPGPLNPPGVAPVRPVVPLLGDRPGVPPPGLSAPPSLMDMPPPAVGGSVGPANPLLALFLEQQIRQQISMQQNPTPTPNNNMNQIPDLVSGSLKRRHVSVSSNSSTHSSQSFPSSSTAAATGGLLPTPSTRLPQPLLPNPLGAGEAVRSLFSTNLNNNAKPSNGLLPTPDLPREQQPNKDRGVPHLMQSFVSGGMTQPGGSGGSGRDDLNSPAKKFPKMDGARGDKPAGLLGDMPDAIKQSIIGYATGRTQNLRSADGGADKENTGGAARGSSSFDPSTGTWEKQSDYGYGYDMSSTQWQSDYSSYYQQQQKAYQSSNNSGNNQSQSTQQQQQPAQPEQSWYQQGSEYSQQYFQQYYSQNQQAPYPTSTSHAGAPYPPPTNQTVAPYPPPTSQTTYSSQAYSYNAAGNGSLLGWSDSQGFKAPSVSVTAPPPPPPLPPSVGDGDPWSAVAPPPPAPGTQSNNSLLGPPPSTPAPIGGTRGDKKPHLLPSPEPSPDGHYVGQHSQGLGGHYADSYIKRGKLDF